MKVTYDDIEFDSNEELMFYHWLIEGKKHGLIKYFSYHIQTYELIEKKTYTEEIQMITKTKKVEKHLLSNLEYTPDFIICLDNLFKFKFKNIFKCDIGGEYFIDVKGGFSGSHNNSAITFPIKQKIMYDKLKIYVNKIEPKKLFKKTWCPEYCFFTPTGKPCKAKWLLNMKTIKEVI